MALVHRRALRELAHLQGANLSDNAIVSLEAIIERTVSTAAQEAHDRKVSAGDVRRALADAIK